MVILACLRLLLAIFTTIANIIMKLNLITGELNINSVILQSIYTVQENEHETQKIFQSN